MGFMSRALLLAAALCHRAEAGAARSSSGSVDDARRQIDAIDFEKLFGDPVLDVLPPSQPAQSHSAAESTSTGISSKLGGSGQTQQTSLGHLSGQARRPPTGDKMATGATPKDHLAPAFSSEHGIHSLFSNVTDQLEAEPHATDPQRVVALRHTPVRRAEAVPAPAPLPQPPSLRVGQPAEGAGAIASMEVRSKVRDAEDSLYLALGLILIMAIYFAIWKVYCSVTEEKATVPLPRPQAKVQKAPVSQSIPLPAISTKLLAPTLDFPLRVPLEPTGGQAPWATDVWSKRNNILMSATMELVRGQRILTLWDRSKMNQPLASVSSSLDVRDAHGRVFGSLEERESPHGSRYALREEQASLVRIVIDAAADGKAFTVLSSPQGWLLATVNRQLGTHDHLNGDFLELMTNDGADAVLVLVCVMAIVVFVDQPNRHLPPIVPQAQQIRSGATYKPHPTDYGRRVC